MIGRDAMTRDAMHASHAIPMRDAVTGEAMHAIEVPR